MKDLERLLNHDGRGRMDTSWSGRERLSALKTPMTLPHIPNFSAKSLAAEQNENEKRERGRLEIGPSSKLSNQPFHSRSGAVSPTQTSLSLASKPRVHTCARKIRRFASHCRPSVVQEGGRRNESFKSNRLEAQSCQGIYPREKQNK